MISFIRFSILFIVLVLLQVLALDNISFYGYATPYLYIYFIIKLPIGINRYFLTLLGFILGLTIDMFCNTPGIAAAATTCVAFFRRPVQGLFFQQEDFDSYIPSVSAFGGNFIKYAVVYVFIHHAILLSVESFSYFNITNLLLKILTSTVLTSLLIFAIDCFSSNKKKV
ncbi:rod shape-determining protein MreD [Dysgonomonas sp. 520]|uniref:rod shape-determining protein MreD n=1 Tax=Dysgonomonas sp. 520 TaxID=2302931 RepID=UPI0013D7B529|nr:rod shape-determining protein MreD [Dysgonomonas sp. 520]NDW09387.1 rod shape-determining protein MreD [Dysgonomonas sp. 520]